MALLLDRVALASVVLALAALGCASAADSEAADDSEALSGKRRCPKGRGEPNDARERATDLGELTDFPTGQVSRAALVLRDGGEHWFTFKVSDKGFLGNPKITANANWPTLEVSAFFLCDNRREASSCWLGGAVDSGDETLGRGCRASGAVKLRAACEGSVFDHGTAIVRVRKAVSDGACTEYDLSINVSE